MLVALWNALVVGAFPSLSRVLSPMCRTTPPVALEYLPWIDVEWSQARWRSVHVLSLFS